MISAAEKRSRNSLKDILAQLARGQALSAQQAEETFDAIMAGGCDAAQIAALLTFLAARGLPVDETTRERISRCGDAELLQRWIVRAATAKTIEDVFAENGAG